MEARNLNREKFVNAILYFALNTNKNKIGKTKMAKLLFALDFEHFKQTGRWVTGAKYYAYPWGPYPKNEFIEIDKKGLPADLEQVVSVIPNTDIEGEERGILFRAKSGKKPNLSIFTPRERKVMERWAEIFHDATAKQMVQWSHSHGEPWKQVWEKEKKQYQQISYSRAIDEKESPISREDAELLINEEEEFEGAFPNRKAG
jgi:hypothetical protein